MNDGVTRIARAATGIAGLDELLGGGLPESCLYVIEGSAGCGKTTLALQFLFEGARLGEQTLFVSFSESEAELRMVADSHGWKLDGRVHLYVPNLAGEIVTADTDYTIFEPADVELNELMHGLRDTIERLRPRRAVIDSVLEMRMLAHDPLRYRRHIIGLKNFFAKRNCTVIFTDESAPGRDSQLQSIAHGVIVLEQIPRDYGASRRRLRVLKLRGSAIREGFHDLVIRHGGVQVFPALIAATHQKDFKPDLYKSGIEGLDSLLEGGLQRGGSTLIAGPSGVGKSSIACAYAMNAARNNERAALFLFDESKSTLMARSASLGMKLDDLVEAGTISITQIDPAQLSPGEFAYLVQKTVDKDGATVVVLDTLNGYLLSMPDEHFPLLHIHELLTYLNQQGVVTLVITAQNGVVGTLESQIDASYLADTMLVLRYFESSGRVRQAISVIKNRHGGHERTIRELALVAGTGIVVGEPIIAFDGVLSGQPIYREQLDSQLMPGINPDEAPSK
ncbi:MAG: AAA family ATPase [Candidatus Binataceae bacterium]|nr:AAA family ATPase [Candidatus Binataceae bacterium]